jgi:hypothetical protein
MSIPFASKNGSKWGEYQTFCWDTSFLSKPDKIPSGSSFQHVLQALFFCVRFDWRTNTGCFLHLMRDRERIISGCFIGQTLAE